MTRRGGVELLTPSPGGVTAVPHSTCPHRQASSARWVTKLWVHRLPRTLLLHACASAGIGVRRHNYARFSNTARSADLRGELNRIAGAGVITSTSWTASCPTSRGGSRWPGRGQVGILPVDAHLMIEDGSVGSGATRRSRVSLRHLPRPGGGGSAATAGASFTASGPCQPARHPAPLRRHPPTSST